MIRQYNPQRFRYHNGRKIGTIPVGTIAYIQDRLGSYDSPVCRNPWIVVAWIPREVGADAIVNGRYENRRMSGGHLAIVRSLRDGREQTVSDWILVGCDDAGLTR